MGLTTLKMVGAVVRNGGHAVFFTYYDDFLDGFEIADLTLDCNLDGQPSPHVVCVGILMIDGGRHVRVRRVRAINWGSRAPDGYVEAFVFAFTGNVPDGIHESYDCVFEDCVAEQASPNNHWNSTLFLIGGNGEEGTRGFKGSGRAMVIRNCFVDARNEYGPVVPIDTISWANGTVTVKTKIPHLHRRPGNLIVSGVVVGNSLKNAFNGVFEIAGIDPDDPTELTYALPSNPGTGSGGIIGGRVSSHSVAIHQIEAVPGSEKVFKLTTKEPHFRTTNNNIKIFNLDGKALNGVFPVVGYDPSEPCVLNFEILADKVDIPLLPPASGQFNQSFAKQGQGHALTADNGVAEGNRVFHCASGGPYHDYWSVHHMVGRDNYYHDILLGPTVVLSGMSTLFFNLALDSLDYDDSVMICPFLGLYSLAQYEDSVAVAKLPPYPPGSPDTVRCHGLVPGDHVRVSASGTDGQIYSGAFTVLETPDAQTFTFVANGMASLPGATPNFLPLTQLPNEYEQYFYPLRPLEAMSFTGPDAEGNYLVTATVLKLGSVEKCGLEKGESVKLGNAGKVGRSVARSQYLNGNFRITEISADGKSFKFKIDHDPDQSLISDPDFSPGYYGRIWRVDYFLAEDNVIELATPILWGNTYRGEYGIPAGSFLLMGGHPGQYVGLQFVVRNNLIRHILNGSDPNLTDGGDPARYPRAMFVWAGLGYGAEYVLVQKNIIRLDNVVNGDISLPETIEFIGNFDLTRGVLTFNNVSADGMLVPAREKYVPASTRPELVTIIRAALEEASTSAFL